MNLMNELCSEEYEIVALMIDDVFAINFANNPIAYGRNKYIEMKFHYLREPVSEGKLNLGYCKS